MKTQTMEKRFVLLLLNLCFGMFSLSVAILTMLGITQTFIHFSDPFNEMVFCLTALLMSLVFFMLVPVKISVEFKFGYLSEDGYKHYPLLYLIYGSNGFSICIIGIIFIIRTKY